MNVGGIHHVTAMTGEPAATVRFYRDVLGLRLVKRTVNFDDPETYHLYFGDARGSPGTAFTVFPYPDGRDGELGAGQVALTSFRVPDGSLDHWVARLDEHDVERGPVTDVFGDRAVGFLDPDGLELELVETGGGGDVEPWGGVVPSEHALRGFAGVTLSVAQPGPTEALLEELGFEPAGEDGDRDRFRLPDADRGEAVDIVTGRPSGSMGVGCVHHVAFRTPDADSQRDWLSALRDRGHRVTDVRDRRYFESIYFREPGGVLLEIATDGPGFDRDKAPDALGETLRLPPWLEDDRDDIEAALPAIEPPATQ